MASVKKLFFVVVFAVIYIAPRDAYSHPDTELELPDELLIAGDNFPPYLDRTQEGKGWAWQIASLALEKAGIKSSLNFAPWARIMQSVGQGKGWHAIFPAYYSTARAEKFYYSDPIINTQLGLFKLRRNTHITFDNDFKNLRPYLIGNCRNCSVREDFDNDHTLNVVLTNNLDSGTKMLLRGRIDLLVGNYHVSQQKVKQMLEADRSYGLTIDDVEFMQPIIQEKPLYLAISKKIAGHKAIIDKFNKALAEVKLMPKALEIYQLNEQD